MLFLDFRWGPGKAVSRDVEVVMMLKLSIGALCVSWTAVIG